MAKENLYVKLRLKIWDTTYDCSAKRYIFEKRAKKLKNRSTILKAFGVIIPSLIGFIGLAYGFNFPFLNILIDIAIPCTIIQFIISLWALFAEWDNELSYSYEEIQSYNSLYQKFRKLAEFPPPTYAELNNDCDLINIESNFREQQDTSHGIKEWEERMGMKYSLREHKLLCYGCNAIPLSLDSTDCSICGKFSFKYRNFIHKIIKS